MAASWLRDKDPELCPLVDDTLRYINWHANDKDLSWPGEVGSMRKWANERKALHARKSNSALATCELTNYLLGLKNDCHRWEGTKYYPTDLKNATLGPPLQSYATATTLV
jgi:hypothetical protein